MNRSHREHSRNADWTPPYPVRSRATVSHHRVPRIDLLGDRQRIANGRQPLGQRGYVLVWMSLLLVVLVGFAGFGVDTANLWFSGQKMQKAADAAALAGVVFLPGNAALAISQAQTVASQNGFTNGVGGDVVTPTQDPTNPDRLDVTITHTQKTLFVGVFGIKQQVLHRSAVAEYQGPVPMGSPTNNLGNQPNWTGGPAFWPAGSSLTTAQQHENSAPGLWANVAGPLTDKQNGDRFSTTYCSSSSYYNCTSSANTEPQQVSTDGTDGYYYIVKTTVGAADLTKRLSIQVFDPAFMDTGNTCDQAESTNSPSGSNNSTTYSPSGAGSTDNATFISNLHTDAGSSHPNWDPTNANIQSMCPGDYFIRSQSYPAPTTYFQVEQPDLTPWDDSDNTPVSDASQCNESQAFWSDGRSTTLPQGTFPPIIEQASGTAATAGVGGPTNSNMGSLDWDLKSTSTGWAPLYAQTDFHNYVTVCNASMADLGITTAGTYNVVLRVRTSAGSAGHNRFAIRGALVTDTSNSNPDGSKVSVYADGKLPIYMNASGSQTIFYIARLLPNNASHTLELDFYDVGDATPTGIIQILPPTDATSGGSALTTFSGCSFSRSPNTLSQSDVTASTCTLGNVNASTGYNGQLMVVSVPIPSGYSCASTDPFGCWVRVSFSYASGAVADTTTWTANLKGDPVRLVM